MPDYDFHQLSPYDLELLTRDLLQAHWGVAIESFKAGKDRGIDLRYATGPAKIIIQVKHYLRSGLPALLRELEREATKVCRLQPPRYVLVTSVSLSATNKDAIVDAIGRDFLKPEDVVGMEDLNNLLGQFPQVEQGHYKLWLASRAVLDRVLHNAAVTRSEFKAQQVHLEARRYVQSGAYPAASEMLANQRVVIISGPPGVGKTTLANLLLYRHLEAGFQAVVIQRDIEEGLSLFQPGTQQVFYFDDFMGATFLGERSSALTGTSDRALLEFIAMVRATPTARLVLTTREHIYSQAKEQSERLRHSDLDDLRVVLRMPSYSLMQRARILYNHVYFSDLPDEYRDELLRGSFYMRIIKHEKFNPRLIEWLSTYRRIKTTPAASYQTFVENLLRDPSEIWRHAYEQELSHAGRSLLLVVFSYQGKATGVFLRTAFERLHQLRAARYGFIARPEDFRIAMRELAGSFTKPFGQFGVEVIDPSVLDLLNTVLREAPQNAVDIITGAATFDQVERIWTFANAQHGNTVLAALRQHASALASAIGPLMVIDRRFHMKGGGYGYRGPTFERRLAIVQEMADRLSSAEVEALIEPLLQRLLREWQSERPQINDAVALISVLQDGRAVHDEKRERIEDIVHAAVADEVRSGCRSDELREWIGVVDTSGGQDSEIVQIGRESFDWYVANDFADELSECRSREQFQGLIEDLELFRSQLGVDVTKCIERTEEALAEFEENESERADYMQNEWKERVYEERDSDRSVSDMFGSLKDNRD